jgi:hypothetical protein
MPLTDSPLATVHWPLDTPLMVFVKAGDFVARTIAGETIIVPVRGQVGDLEAIYNFNDVGSFIWERLDGRASVDQIIEALCQEFEVPREQAAQDAAEFLESLQSAGLITPSGGGDQP